MTPRALQEHRSTDSSGSWPSGSTSTILAVMEIRGRWQRGVKAVQCLHRVKSGAAAVGKTPTCRRLIDGRSSHKNIT